MTLAVSARDYAVMPQKPVSQFSQDVGRRLARTRDARGLTQEQLARDVNMTRSAVGNFEQGTRKLDGESAVRLSARLGVTTDWLLRGDPSNLPVSLAEKLLGPGSPHSGSDGPPAGRALARA